MITHKVGCFKMSICVPQSFPIIRTFLKYEVGRNTAEGLPGTGAAKNVIPNQSMTTYSRPHMYVAAQNSKTMVMKEAAVSRV